MHNCGVVFSKLELEQKRIVYREYSVQPKYPSLEHEMFVRWQRETLERENREEGQLAVKVQHIKVRER